METIDCRIVMTYTKEYKESMQKYINSLLEKENNIMSKNLGKSLTGTLKEQATNFAKWQSASQTIMNGCKSLKKMSDSVEEVNDSLVGLGK